MAVLRRMSEIKSIKNNPPVQRLEDVVEYYGCVHTNPHTRDHVSRIGMEIEHNFYKNSDQSPIDQKTNVAILEAAGRQGVPVHQEPSAVTMEILSDPFAPDNAQSLIDQMERRFTTLVKTARDEGAALSPFAHLPHIKPGDHPLIDNQRYRAFWVPPRTDMVDAAHSFLDPSIQVSVSYDNCDQLLNIVRMSIALEPFLTLTTDASVGFFEGQSIDYCPRMAILNRRGRNGGIPEFYYTAKSGEELIEAHINYILHNKHVFVCYNHDGDLVKLPAGEWPSFLELEKLGYGPCNFLNYRQAQSENWRRTTNIAELRDDSGNIYGHRAEISSLFCTGPQHQRVSAVLLTWLMAYSGDFYSKTGELLKDFGIDLEAMDECREQLDANYNNCYKHKNRYHDLSFGNKTLKDFALPFADIVEESLNGSGIEDHAKPLLHILREGRPDWLVNRECFTTLEDVKNHMREFPERVQAHPELISADSCADFALPLLNGCLAA